MTCLTWSASSAARSAPGSEGLPRAVLESRAGCHMVCYYNYSQGKTDAVADLLRVSRQLRRSNPDVRSNPDIRIRSLCIDEPFPFISSSTTQCQGGEKGEGGSHRVLAASEQVEVRLLLDRLSKRLAA